MDTTVEEALEVVREALSAEGFGKRLPAGVPDVLAEAVVLRRAELGVVVRAPEQAPDLDAPRGGVGEDVADLGAGTVQELVRVAAPVREEEEVAGLRRPDGCQDVGEAGRAVDERADRVPSSVSGTLPTALHP